MLGQSQDFVTRGFNFVLLIVLGGSVGMVPRKKFCNLEICRRRHFEGF